MKFFWYVKALYIMHDTKMTKMMPSRISPCLSDTTHRAKWSVNAVSRRLFFVKTVHRQPKADWPLFRLCSSQWRPQTNSQMESNFCFLSVLLSEDSAQTAKWRITAVFCFSQWRQCTDSQMENNRSFLSFSGKTVLGLSRAVRLLLHTCFSSYRLVHRQQYTD
jgi:hypothetical protein